MVDVNNFPAVAALVIFGLAIVLTIFLVFKEIAVSIPVQGRRHIRINFKYYVAPVAAVLAMLACTSMSIGDVGRGLLGNDQIKPYGILILFMSMAYIAGSLDATGVFAWLALKFTTMSGGRGRVLFLFYFLLSSFITTFTSNDVCILTLTPIVCYFAKATGVDPMPFLFAEYAAANTFGALLYTGNPTNIIVADAYDMTFLGYSKYMTLPTFAAGLACFGMLLLEFHKSIPIKIPLPTVDASHMLRDKLGAAVGSVNMLTCLALLAAAPSLKWEMWAITLVCAGVHCVYNVWAFRSTLTQVPLAECWTCGGEKEDSISVSSTAAADANMDNDGGKLASISGSAGMEAKHVPVNGCTQVTAQSHASVPFPVSDPDAAPASAAFADDGCEQSTHSRGSGNASAHYSAKGSNCAKAGYQPAGEGDATGDWVSVNKKDGEGVSSNGHTGSRPLPEAAQLAVGQPPVTAVILAPAPMVAEAAVLDMSAEVGAAPAMTVDSLRGKAPTFWALFFDLPWEVVPFALGMFVLVEALNVQGWLTVFGTGLGRASTALPAAVFIMGFLSVALANTINNQPMTILLTRVALDSRFTNYVGKGNTHKAALFALVLASNIGAVFTLIGALAGILWSNIMGVHGLNVSYSHFLRVCCPVGFMTLVASLLVLWFEFAVFPHED